MGSRSYHLPGYQPRLAAFHRAFAAELRAVIRHLPMSPQMRVLDVACGDGFYDRLIAERLDRWGSVTGLDSNPAYIEVARSAVSQWSNVQCAVSYIQGKLQDLPEQQSGWDLVWCAQSLYSLPEPVTALRQMAQLVQPGGLVVVLENDTLHQLLLPWPTEVELALRTAELAALADKIRQPSKFYIGRRLPAVFAEAGLEPLYFRSQCIDRQAPLEPDVLEFLQLYLEDLTQRASAHLEASLAAALAELIDPAHPRYLLGQPHFTMSWLNVLAWGRRR